MVKYFQYPIKKYVKGEFTFKHTFWLRPYQVFKFKNVTDEVLIWLQFLVFKVKNLADSWGLVLPDVNLAL